MTFLKKSFLFLALAFLSSCGDPNAGKAKALQNEIEQLQRSVAEAQQAVKRMEIQVQAAKDERKKLEEDKSKAAEQKSNADQELEKLKEEFNAYKMKYKVSVRDSIPGLELEPFMVNASQYKGAKVEALDVATLKFKHTGGLATSLVSELPDRIKDQLGLSSIHEPCVVKTSLILANKAQSMNGLRREHSLETEAFRLEVKRMKDQIESAKREVSSESSHQSFLKSHKKQVSIQRVDYLRQLELRHSQLLAQLALLESEQVTQLAEHDAERKALTKKR
jgi:hypothetical protein